MYSSASLGITCSLAENMYGKILSEREEINGLHCFVVLLNVVKINIKVADFSGFLLTTHALSSFIYLCSRMSPMSNSSGT